MNDIAFLPTIKNYFELCKPRVVALMMLTAWVAMYLAHPTTAVTWQHILYSSLGISLAAAAGGVMNQIADQKLDTLMARTQHRPLPAGHVRTTHAMVFMLILIASSMGLMFTRVNLAAALLTLFTLIAYGGFYTFILKKQTPQNIVIGGLAGAMPPLLGWSSMTGAINGEALLLVLIIFTWTPPHFWSLSIHRYEDYQQAQIPMLPVTHGIPFTKLNILVYTVLMISSTYLTFAVPMFGQWYLLGATVLNIIFLYYVIRLYRSQTSEYALSTFHYSIIYLACLFALMLIDRV